MIQPFRRSRPLENYLSCPLFKRGMWSSLEDPCKRIATLVQLFSSPLPHLQIFPPPPQEEQNTSCPMIAKIRHLLEWESSGKHDQAKQRRSPGSSAIPL